MRRIQEYIEHINTREVSKKIKIITRKFKFESWAILNDNQQFITDFDKVLDRWRKYYEELYMYTTTVRSIADDYVQEPDILMDEMVPAINRLANKSPGVDMITAEVLKSLPQNFVKIIHSIYSPIWKTRKWSKD